MKNFIAALCVLIVLPAVAAPRDYIASEIKEDGAICARVQVVTVGHNYVNRNFCRTESEWIEAGYKVSRRPILPAELEDHEQF
jgi:hypothetical protein